MSSKSKSNKFSNTIDECLTNGVKNGIFQVSLEDQVLNGREVTINGKKVVNFGSCSYLGLETDERLKHGAIDATLRYGTQYSSSRLFSACNLYEEIESLFYKIFNNNHAILAATTTLAHLGALPILVQDDDLIILDHNMPRMNGRQTLGFLKSSEHYTHIPVIVYSTNGDGKLAEECASLGASLVASKPAGYDEYEEMINGFLKLIAV